MTNNSEHRWRVKLYSLNASREWEDCGTGYLTTQGTELIVESEENPDIKLIEFEIGDEVFRIEKSSIVTWTSLESVYALSFQDSRGAKEIYEHIYTIQDREPLPERTDDSSDEEQDQLPTVTKSNLTELANSLNDAAFFKKDKLAQRILSTCLLDELKTIFSQAEAENDTNTLKQLFEVVKSLSNLHTVQLNNNALLDTLLSDDHYLTFFGILECNSHLDDTLFHDPSANYRKFLSQDARFVNVLKIEDKEFLSKIHTTYRLQLLKDLPLNRLIEDATANFILNLYVFHLNELLTHFIENLYIRDKLISMILLGNFQAYKMLYDIMMISKMVMIPTRLQFYEILRKENFLEYFQYDGISFKWSEEQKNNAKYYMPEMLSAILMMRPDIVRQYAASDIQREAGFPFIQSICSSLFESMEISIQQQISDLIKTLLEPNEDDKFFDLCDLIFRCIINKFVEKFSSVTLNEETRLTICEILGVLSKSIETHIDKMRVFVTYNDVLQNTIKLLDLNDKTITLSVIRFIRIIIEKNDAFLLKFLIAHNILEPIFRIFKNLGTSQNMIFSSILALIESVFNSDSQILISHIVISIQVKKHIPHIKSSETLKYFNKIIERYNMHMEEEERL